MFLAPFGQLCHGRHDNQEAAAQDRQISCQTNNIKTKKYIEALRAKECMEVTIQGDNIKTLTVEDLEISFQLQHDQLESVLGMLGILVE